MNKFIDSPTEVEKILETLTDAEQKTFNLGYIIALVNIIEQLRDSKIKLLNKIYDVDESTDNDEDDKRRLQLTSRLRILDMYDEHYTKRVNQLAQNYTLSP